MTRRDAEELPNDAMDPVFLEELPPLESDDEDAPLGQTEVTELAVWADDDCDEGDSAQDSAFLPSLPECPSETDDALSPDIATDLCDLLLQPDSADCSREDAEGWSTADLDSLGIPRDVSPREPLTADESEGTGDLLDSLVDGPLPPLDDDDALPAAESAAESVAESVAESRGSQ